MNRTALLLVPAALLTAVVAGCSETRSAAQPAAPSTPASSQSTPAPAAGLAVKDTNLGQIIVAGNGMTAYVFDKDVAGSGNSACTGDCLKIWAAVPAGPTAPGITAAVGAITGGGGVQQVTVAGLPLYTFVNDKNPGDTNGQLFKNLWHVVTPSGQKVG